jgi:AbrB family looped-hinge helix DNA binding protein
MSGSFACSGASPLKFEHRGPRVGPKGQVVIPKQLRDEVGLRPGAEVEFERDGETVRVMPAGAAAVQGLRGRYASSGLAAALLADRDREPR